MRCTSQYVVNKNVFSERLKLSLPTAGTLKLSGTEFHTDGPATANALRPCAEPVARHDQLSSAGGAEMLAP